MFAKFLSEVITPAGAISYLHDVWVDLDIKKIGPYEERVTKVFHSIFVFAFASAGGFVAQHFYWRRQKQEAGLASHSR